MRFVVSSTFHPFELVQLVDIRLHRRARSWVDHLSVDIRSFRSQVHAASRQSQKSIPKQLGSVGKLSSAAAGCEDQGLRCRDKTSSACLQTRFRCFCPCRLALGLLARPRDDDSFPTEPSTTTLENSKALSGSCGLSVGAKAARPKIKRGKE